MSYQSILNLLQNIINDGTQHAKALVVNRDTNALYDAATIGVASYLVFCLLQKTCRFVFTGPVRQWVGWKLSASSRRAFSEKVCNERDTLLATLVTWAQSTKDSPVPSLKDRRELTELGIVELRTRMIEKKLSPVFLLKCFILNAHDAQKLTNCISVIAPLDADGQHHPITLALQAEKKYAEGNVDVKEQPLLGIPMSIKDCLFLEGTYATAGCFCFAANGKSKHSSANATMLRAAGAIIFCKSNVPQTMLSYDCENNVFGTTGNAFKPSHSPGGSSGGECALVALRGAAAGIGTDVGGSNRICNVWNGVYGLRPSLWRVCSYGGVTPVPGQESITSTAGPVARSISDMVEVFRAMVAEDASKIDGNINHIPFRDEMFDKYAKEKKTLKIGFFTDDGWLVSSPANRRAVLEAVEKLKKAGHEITEFSPDTIVEAMYMFYKFVAADGCETVSQRFDGFEPPMPAVVVTYLKGRVMPTWFFEKLIPFFSSFGSELLATGLAGIKNMTAAEFFAALNKRNSLRHEFARAIAAFDCVITPSFVIPAPKIGSTFDKPFGVSYTAAINVLDNSAVVIPTTQVDPKKDAWTTPEVVKNNSAQKKQFDLMDKKMRSIYDAEEMAGLPVGIQVLTPKSSEERCLGCAQRIVTDLGLESMKPPSIV